MKPKYIRPGCLSYKRRLIRYRDAAMAWIEVLEAEADLCSGDPGAWYDSQRAIERAWRRISELQDDIDEETRLRSVRETV